MVLLLWLMNFLISIFNGWVCGRSWDETKAQGGLPHFMNWMGVIMAASGFTWCYVIAFAFLGSSLEVEAEDGTMGPLVDPEAIRAMIELGYVVIIGPVIGSGIAITLEAWGVWWRRRTFGSGAVALYNTAAMAHNVYSAAQVLPGVLEHLGHFFTGGFRVGSGKSDGKNTAALLVIFLVVCALIAGVLTTWAIVNAARTATANSRALHYGGSRW